MNLADTGARIPEWAVTATVIAAGATVLALAEAMAGEAGRVAAARGGVWVEGRRASGPEERIPAGATATLRLPPGGRYSEVALAPADLVYEDEWLVVLDKRPGWYAGATPWDCRGNVLAALGRYLAARDGAAPPLHLAHRLDRDTSGLLLVSKAPAANPALQAAFATGRVAKAYSCLCAGAPAWERLDLRTGHGRAAGGRWRIYPLDEVGRELPAGGGRVREAWTSFVVEARLASAALLRAELHTGRTHQIRLHMAHVGHPLLGDERYGGPASYGGQVLQGHILHAGSLSLPHPMTGAALELTSPLPRQFTELLGLRPPDVGPEPTPPARRGPLPPG